MSTEKPQLNTQPNQLRRKLFKGAYGGVGVLMAVQAKTALGGSVCQSPSAMMSGNVSQRADTGIICSGGRSPGFWKQPKHFGYWTAAGAMPPKFDAILDTCSVNLSALSSADITAPGTLLSAVFTDAPAVSMWVVLADPKASIFGTNGQLLRHLSAAWLNALYFAKSSDQQYPLTTVQIQEMWNETKGGGIYCPNGMTCGPNQGWSANQVIDYIDGMYDINSDIDDPLPCKKNKR